MKTRAFYAVLLAALFSAPAQGWAQVPDGAWPSTDYASMGGEELYRAACAGCHGPDGTGMPSSAVGFALPLPDFTDCGFASREPDGDWLAVSHEGGPTRGFDPLMPAFGGALTVDQLQRALDYVRTLCADANWPRGELNLPRAMITEKAYPEDEAVFTYGASLDGPAVLTGEFVYEKRFGARNQIEFVVPFSYRSRGDDRSWQGGLGDFVIGVKRAFYHSLEKGSIFSAAAEIKLPTGNHELGFGAGTPVFETFASYGHILPADAFLQLQAIYERPFDVDRAGDEAALRLVLGKSFTQGAWGRTWSPMVEVLTSRELEDGATLHWDLVPQFQVSLNTRQHVLANLAVRVPVNDTLGREPTLLFYVLWDWFDGGFFEGW
jgi:mono/diheme cytochrome c family protein